MNGWDDLVDAVGVEETTASLIVMLMLTVLGARVLMILEAHVATAVVLIQDLPRSAMGKGSAGSSERSIPPAGQNSKCSVI